MANPVVSIRNTGRDSASLSDVRALSDNVITSATSATTGTIAVTADATYDVSFTQPADTSIKNLIMIANGNLVTAGASGDDIDFDLGTAAGGGQIIDEKAIADDGGSAVTLTANTPLYIISDGIPAAANAFAILIDSILRTRIFPSELRNVINNATSEILRFNNQYPRK